VSTSFLFPLSCAQIHNCTTGADRYARPLNKAHLGLVPAIGGKGHVPSAPSITSISDFAPRPAIPEPPKPLFSPHIKSSEVDPESLLPGVIEDLVAVTRAWQLEKNNKSGEDLSIPFDVLEVLKTTTRAIRSTRNYLLSLPDESTDALRTEVQYRPRMFGPRTREPSLTSSTRASSSKQKQPCVPDSIARIRRSALEVLTVLRQLEEFYRLPLEDDAYDAHSDGDNSRIMGTSSTPLDGILDLPIEDDRTTNRSDYDPDMSISFSIVQVQGQYKSIPVWEDDDDDSSLEREERSQKKDGWEERLVLGTGWLYRQDVKLSDLQAERAIVASYLDIVDEVLFHGKPAGETSANDDRGWERVQKQREWKASLRGARNRRVSAADGEGKSLGLDFSLANSGKRRVSTSMVDLMGRMRLSDEPEEMDRIHEDEDGNEELSDDDLPEWARRSTFVDDRLGQPYLFYHYVRCSYVPSMFAGRAHALLAHLLPPSLIHTLGRPDSRNDFLQSLASGQLLCVAYNSCVRKSKEPWGFVNKDGIHDILTLERAAVANGEESIGKKVWTFRRIDNLRLWVG